jgi:glycerol-3-phosphate dehydrogenase
VDRTLSPDKRSARPPLLEGPFDLAVVGGGVNGTAIARDAVLRGKSVLLVEKGDFASGTSSASSKMVHGGIRYLEQLRLGLVYEALRERHLLLRLAPHLVRPQSFIIPVYEGARRGPRAIRLGLFLYDILACGRRLGRSRFLTPAEVLERVPELLSDGLLGGGVYFDAVMDDARLCLASVVAAQEEGRQLGVPVVVRNYTEMLRHEPASPLRLVVRDRLSGEDVVVRAHRLVRALGPWSDPALLARSKGVHLVLPRFPTADGLLLTHAADGRVFFLVPWLGRTVVGTTETPFDRDPEDLRVEPEEVRYLMDEVRRLFPKVSLPEEEILATFAGVRPLARASRLFGRRSLGSASRTHRIARDADGVLTLVGGKYTTYRAVAREVVDRLFPGSTCSTHRTPLPGGEGGPWSEFQKRIEPAAAARGMEEAERLFRRYGARLGDVLRLAERDPALGERLSPAMPELRAEAVHTILHELVVYPADFLARRTALRYGPGGGRDAYDAVEALIREHAPVVPRDLDVARERYFADLAWEDTLRHAPS